MHGHTVDYVRHNKIQPSRELVRQTDWGRHGGGVTREECLVFITDFTSWVRAQELVPQSVRQVTGGGGGGWCCPTWGRVCGLYKRHDQVAGDSSGGGGGGRSKQDKVLTTLTIHSSVNYSHPH